MYKVLIVEADPQLGLLMDSTLGKSGSFEIVTEKSLRDALIHLSMAPVDGVALDLNLPDTDGGLESFQTIYGKYPGVPIVVLTRYHERQREALLEGAADALVYPFNLESLLGKLVGSIERNRAQHRTEPTQRAAQENAAFAKEVTDSVNRLERPRK